MMCPICFYIKHIKTQVYGEKAEMVVGEADLWGGEGSGTLITVSRKFEWGGAILLLKCAPRYDILIDSDHDDIKIGACVFCFG